MNLNDLADERNTLEDAIVYLEQYRDYAESMRQIGRGFSPSGPYSVDSLVAQLRAQRLRVHNLIGELIGAPAVER